MLCYIYSSQRYLRYMSHYVSSFNALWILWYLVDEGIWSIPWQIPSCIWQRVQLVICGSKWHHCRVSSQLSFCVKCLNFRRNWTTCINFVAKSNSLKKATRGENLELKDLEESPTAKLDALVLWIGHCLLLKYFKNNICFKQTGRSFRNCEQWDLGLEN